MPAFAFFATLAVLSAQYAPPGAPPIPPPPNLAIPPSPPPPAARPLPVTGPHPPPIPQAPWFGSKPVPTEDEQKILKAARETVEKNREVVIATRTYAERFGAADDLVRTLIFANPAINDPLYQKYLPTLKMTQVLHETTWNIGLDNNPDFLLPDPNVGPVGHEFLSIHMSSGTIGPRQPLEEVLSHYHSDAATEGIRASYGLDEIRQAALNNPDAQAALQKTRAAFGALDTTVRDAMAKDPAVKALIEKYPYLLYGRQDLGLQVVAMLFMT